MPILMTETKNRKNEEKVPRKVKATRLGYYNERRMKAGDVFAIDYPREFSKSWMVYVDAPHPEREEDAAEAYAEYQRANAEAQEPKPVFSKDKRSGGSSGDRDVLGGGR